MPHASPTPSRRYTPTVPISGRRSTTLLSTPARVWPTERADGGFWTMDERTKLGLGVLGTALVLGSLGDWLLRATPWGINVLLWVAVLAGAAVALSRWGRLEVVGEGRWLVPVAVFFAAALAWRDSPVVASLKVLAALVALSLAVFRGRRGGIQLFGISEYVLGGIYTGILSSAGPLPVMIRDVR